MLHQPGDPLQGGAFPGRAAKLLVAELHQAVLAEDNKGQAYLMNGVLIHRDAHMEPEFSMKPIPRERLKRGDLKKKSRSIPASGSIMCKSPS